MESLLAISPLPDDVDDGREDLFLVLYRGLDLGEDEVMVFTGSESLSTDLRLEFRFRCFLEVASLCLSFSPEETAESPIPLSKVE